MNPHKYLATAILFAGAVAAPAHAAGDSEIASYYSAAYQTCLQTAKAMRPVQHCNAQEIEYQEAALDREFQALLAAHPADRARLQSEQDGWKDQTEATCTVFSRRQGSLNSMKAQDCFRIEAIRRRIALEAEFSGGTH